MWIIISIYVCTICKSVCIGVYNRRLFCIFTPSTTPTAAITAVTITLAQTTNAAAAHKHSMQFTEPKKFSQTYSIAFVARLLQHNSASDLVVIFHIPFPFKNL